MQKTYKRFIITVFGSLSSQKKDTHGYKYYKISKYFYNHEALRVIYCLDYDDGIAIPSSYIRSLFSFKINKIIFKLISKIRIIIPSFPTRLIQEILFDIFCFIYLKRDKWSGTLINLKPVIPLSVKAFKRKYKNSNIISLSTIAHPRFNYVLVRKLQNKYQLPKRSIYTNVRRVRRLEKVFKLSDKIFMMVNSEFIRKTYLRYQIPIEKLITTNTNPGIDTNFFTPIKKNRYRAVTRFLTLGYLNLIKGIPLLIDAWIGISEDQKANAKLILGGEADKDIREILSREKKQLSRNMQLLGYVENLVSIYNRNDVFIAASVSDNGPSTLLEAMACGVPVIVSKNCGLSELIEHGREGFIYDPLDIKTLRKYIIWFINNKNKIPEMGEKAREKAMHFKLDDYVPQFFEACRNLTKIKRISKHEIPDAR